MCRCISKMAEGGTLESERPAVGGKKAGALTLFNLADLRHCNFGSLLRRLEARGSGRRHGTDNFVVVATAQDTFESGRVARNDRLCCIRKRYSPDIDVSRDAGCATQLGKIADKSVGD